MTISRSVLGWTRWSVILLALSQPGPAQTNVRAPAPQRPAQGNTADYRKIDKPPTYILFMPRQWYEGPPPGHCLKFFPPANTREAWLLWFPCHVEPVKSPIPDRLP